MRIHLLVYFMLMTLTVASATDQVNASTQPLPTVRANSPTIDVRFGDGPFLKGAWHLNPEFSPDVFVIPSRLPYGRQKMTFKSDVDEISFDVEAGNEYDIIFMLNGETPSHTRVWARPDPAIWSRKFLISVCLGLLVFTIGVFTNRKKLQPESLLWFGVLAPIIFWLTTITSANIRGDYNHFENVISQLGEIGSRAEIFTSIALLVICAFCVLFSIGLYKASKRLGISRIPAILSLAFPMIVLWATVFPLRNEIHGLLDPLFLLAINLGALLAFILWRKHEGFSKISRWSLYSFFLMMLLLPLMAARLPINYDGLIQRTWYIGWTVWFVSLSIGFRKRLALSN